MRITRNCSIALAMLQKLDDHSQVSVLEQKSRHKLNASQQHLKGNMIILVASCLLSSIIPDQHADWLWVLAKQQLFSATHLTCRSLSILAVHGRTLCCETKGFANAICMLLFTCLCNAAYCLFLLADVANALQVYWATARGP